MSTSSRLSLNCYGAHKFRHNCAVRYTKVDSVRAGKRICLRIFTICNDGGKFDTNISELEFIDAIGGHCPNYIQRTRLSANVKTIQETLSFLNKLQIMEDIETRNSLRQETVRAAKHRSQGQSTARPPAKTRTGTTDRGLNPKISGTRATENSSYDQNRQCNQHSSGPELQTASPQERRRSWQNANTGLYSPERTNNNSRDRNAQSEISGQDNFRPSGACILIMCERCHRGTFTKEDRCIIGNV